MMKCGGIFALRSMVRLTAVSHYILWHIAFVRFGSHGLQLITWCHCVFVVVFHTFLRAFRVLASRFELDFVSQSTDTCSDPWLSITSIMGKSVAVNSPDPSWVFRLVWSAFACRWSVCLCLRCKCCPVTWYCIRFTFLINCHSFCHAWDDAIWAQLVQE